MLKSSYQWGLVSLIKMYIIDILIEGIFFIKRGWLNGNTI